MDWLLLATGFTGALTLIFLVRLVYRSVATPASVESHFSPGGLCTDAILRELALARREILMLAYTFTTREISQALIDAKLRGVHVEIVLDHSNEKEPHTELPFLIEQGLAPLIDHQHAIAHNKIIIIDGRTVLTGSFNFTHQAERSNAENLLIIKGHPELATTYHEQFVGHKSHSRVPQVAPHLTAKPVLSHAA